MRPSPIFSTGGWVAVARARPVQAVAILAAAILAASACGSGSEPGGAWGGGGDYGYGGYAGYGGSTATTSSTTTTPPPPEKEVESSFTAPVATGKYVWIANPSSGRVAYIDATTQEVKLLEAGNGPTYVAAVPNEDVALVLNVLSLDATIFRASSSGVTAATVPVPASGNSWAVSSHGTWAIAWTDTRGVTNPDPVEGYQDIAVVNLTPGAETSVDLTVGYRPVAVAFDKKGDRAFAVTQDGVSVIMLTGASPAVVKNIPLADTPEEPATTRDVAITPDGTYALVRRDGKASIDVFSLNTGTRTSVPLPAPATDLDLSADGATAVVVIRDADADAGQGVSQVALLPIPDVVAGAASPVLIDMDTVVGSASLASQSSVAFFYTNATASKNLVVMDTQAAPPVPGTVLMRAPILGVFPTANAAHAVVLHDALEEAGSHYPAAVSLAPIALGLPPKIIGVDAPLVSIAITPAGDHAIIAAGDEKTGVYQALLGAMPSLAVQKFKLASLPIAAGIVAAADCGYVAQKHPDGRITFFNLQNGEARTITGFELATQVVDGTQ